VKEEIDMSNSMHSDDRYTDAPLDLAEEIEDSIEIPDDFPNPEELVRDLKRIVTIRLDTDVYEWFRLPGAGYQTRINAVLRAYMESKSRKEIARVPFGARVVPVGSKRLARGKKAAAKRSKKVARASAKKGSRAKPKARR
jgi:uncharacterized protein (DUF4415 family)